MVDYGVTGQIGYGQSYAAYSEDMASVFRTLHDWTKDDGSLWLVVDTFLDQSRRPSAIRPLPFELAGLAERSGWTLRDVIIWRKNKTRPWITRGRLRNAFEYVLYLVKTPDFIYNIDRLRDSTDLARWWVRYPERYNPQGKAPDNVWDIPIPVQGSWGLDLDHACPLPVELVRRIIFLSTNPGDVVCDPFAGVGTVVATAEGMGRRGWGLELNKEFCKKYLHHLRPEVLERVFHDQADATPDDLRDTVLSLRAVKYPKALMAGLHKEFPHLPRPYMAAVVVASPTKKRNLHQLLEVSTIFALRSGRGAPEEDVRLEVEEAIKSVSCRAPLTKFGIAGDIAVVDRDEFERRLQGLDLWVYQHGRTWSAVNDHPFSAGEVFRLGLDPSAFRGRYCPIVASVCLRLVDDGRLPVHQDLSTLG
jgi:DNA modification methylase